MDNRKNNQTDPWDEGVYGTGNTMPPKSHSGIIALLLVLVIFLSGIVSMLSFLNIRLFQQLSQQQDIQEHAPVSFSDLHLEEPSTVPTLASDPAREDISMSLHKSPQSVENMPQADALSLQQIYEKNLPSVVSITSSTSTGNVSGTGVILSPEGFILTTCHVAADAETITVQFPDGTSCSAMAVGADRLTDLAVLYVDAPDLVPAEFGDSDALRVGDSVFAMGDWLGLTSGSALSQGIVSGIHPNLMLQGQPISLIQTNIPAGEGDSGGPLINCFGQVIGINSTGLGSAFLPEEAAGTGFALPSTTLKAIVDQLLSQGYVSGRPSLGITGEEISRFDQYYFHIPQGLYITGVDHTSDAHRQGIEPGDILISLEGNPISSQSQLDSLIFSLQIGDTVTAVLYRDGKEQMLVLTLTEYVG